MGTQKAQPRRNANNPDVNNRRGNPMTPKAGFTKTRRRLSNGGKVSK